MPTKVIHITPMPAPRMTQNNTWKHGKYFAYKDDLRLALPGYLLPAVLSIEFHLPISKSWSQKKKTALLGQYHQYKPDIDNLIKGFLDAFRVDDAHVSVIHAGKYWSETGKIIIEYDKELPSNNAVASLLF